METRKPERLMERRCQGTKQDGTACRLPHLPDSKYCRHHDQRFEHKKARSDRATKGYKGMVQNARVRSSGGIDSRLRELLDNDDIDKKGLSRLAYLVTANLLLDRLTSKQAEVTSKLITQQMKLLGVGEDNDELDLSDLADLPENFTKMLTEKK